MWENRRYERYPSIGGQHHESNNLEGRIQFMIVKINILGLMSPKRRLINLRVCESKTVHILYCEAKLPYLNIYRMRPFFSSSSFLAKRIQCPVTLLRPAQIWNAGGTGTFCTLSRRCILLRDVRVIETLSLFDSPDDDEVMLNVLRCQLTY